MRRAYDYWQDQPGCYFETGAHTSTQMLPCPRTSHSVSPPVGMPYRTHSARERAECFPSSDQITVISGLQKTQNHPRPPSRVKSERSLNGLFVLPSCIFPKHQLSWSCRRRAPPAVGSVERIAGPLRALRDSGPSLRGARGFTPSCDTYAQKLSPPLSHAIGSVIMLGIAYERDASVRRPDHPRMLGARSMI